MQKTTLGFNLYEKDDTFDITGETGLNATIEKINEVVEETKKSVSDGKEQLAAAITEKGIDTASEDTFETMAEKIKQIQSAGYGMHGKADTTIASDGTVRYVYGSCTIEQEDE